MDANQYYSTDIEYPVVLVNLASVQGCGCEREHSVHMQAAMLVASKSVKQETLRRTIT